MSHMMYVAGLKHVFFLRIDPLRQVYICQAARILRNIDVTTFGICKGATPGGLLYVCISMYIHIHVYMYTHTHTYIHIY